MAHESCTPLKYLRGNMTNYSVGKDFEEQVIKLFKSLEEVGVVSIIGSNMKIKDKDGNSREIDILVKFLGQGFSLDVCVECKKRKRVKIDVIDRIRSLRQTTQYNNFMIISDTDISKPTKEAAERDNIPILLFDDFQSYVENVMSREEELEAFRRSWRSDISFMSKHQLKDELSMGIWQSCGDKDPHTFPYHLTHFLSSADPTALALLRLTVHSKRIPWRTFKYMLIRRVDSNLKSIWREEERAKWIPLRKELIAI